MAITLNGTTGITTPGLIADSPTLTVDSANNRIGIGTVAPANELEVWGTGTVALFSGSGGSGFIGIQDRDDGTLGFIGVDGGNLKFQTPGSSYSDKLFIASAGNVGIGTDNPNWKTTIHGGSGGTETALLNLHVPSYDSNTGSILRFSNSTSTSSTFGTAEIRGLRTDFATGYTDLIFTTSDGDNVTEKLRIKGGSGNIGIGTDDPVGSLEIRDSKANLIVAKDGLTVKSNSDLHTSYDTLQIGAGGALLSYSVETVTADTQFVHNVYRSSGGTFKYRYTDTAARLRVNSPGRTWIFESAASGNADADITFTEQLRIRGAGSHLLVGTGGDATYNEMTESADHSCVIIGKNAMSNGGLVIRTGNTGTGRIYFADNSGNDPGRNVGRIGYYHSNDSMVLGAGGSDTMTMFAGNVRISGAGNTAGTSQSPLAVSSNLGTITAFFGAQTSVTGLTSSQYSSAIRFNGADVAWGDIAYFPNGDSEYGSFRFGRHGSTISSYPSASIGVNKVYTTGGIDFKTTTEASGMTSELFDDYEEGTFTPIVRGRTTAGTTTYSRTAVGKYVKIGRSVNVMIDVAFNSATGTGNIEFGGLPFQAHSGPYVRFSGSITLLVAGISWSNQIAPYINDGTSHFWIVNTPTSGTFSFVNINSSSSEVLLNCTYMVS